MERKIKKFHENETNEFYDGGTYSDAEEVMKELEKQHPKACKMQLDSCYGWIVIVKKQLK